MSKSKPVSPEIAKNRRAERTRLNKKWKADEERHNRLKDKLAKRPGCFMSMDDKTRDSLDLMECLECIDFQQCHKLSLIILASRAADNYCAHGGDSE